MRGNKLFYGINPGFRDMPSEYWSKEEWALVEGENQPIGKESPATPSGFQLPRGFRLFEKPDGRERHRDVDRLLTSWGIRKRR